MHPGKAGLRLHQVLLQVKDIERSREFYTKKLGFSVLYDFSPQYLAVITPNKLQIGLYPSRRGARRARTRDQTAGLEFEVDNVEYWYRMLRRRGIRFSEKPKDSWGEREARFTDPDGYRLAISSPAKKSSK
ncbi:MAG TPA: VOC family protein [Candidatus Bathyarchaeia archaeon]|nr:VOC family protein [Candidatus Bathyarchaeia archaeon]